METFQINCSFNKDSFTRLNILRWRLSWRESQKKVILVLPLFFLIFLIERFTEVTTSFEQIIQIVGISVISVLFIVFLIRSILKKMFLAKVRSIAESFYSNRMDYSYTFTVDKIIYQDKEKTSTLPCSEFTFYSLYENYIVLFKEDCIKEAIIIDQESIKPEEHDKIITYSQKRFQYKRL